MPPSDRAEDRRRVEVLVEERRLEEAARALEPICESASATARDWLILGQLRLQLNQTAAALTALERADTESPGQASIVNALAHALFSLGRAEDAYARLQGQIAWTPGDPEIHFNLGYIGEQLQKRDEACAHYGAALNLDADHYRARLNRGALLSDLGTLDDALADYEVLVEAYPEDAAAWFSRAECLVKCRRFVDAAASAERALAIDPSYVKAMLCKAVALASCGEVRPAQDLFNAAWAQNRDAASRYGHADDPMSSVPDARAIHVYQEFQCLYRADWSGYAEFAASFEKYIASAEGSPSDVSMAFPAMYAPLPAQSRAKVHVAITSAIASVAGAPMPPVLPSGKQRLRVAYLSSKFRASPSFVLVNGLLEAHDRGRFEIFGYALNPDDGSVERVQSADAVDVFVDLSATNDEEAARRIRGDGIDILIDLNGYSNEARPGILARRPAPLQVNYLGHMHSLYAPWIDYRFTDAVAEPEAAGYSPPEARVFLPPSYYVYDERRRPSSLAPERTALGLPQDAFVFCAFSGVAKIEPVVFAAWMAILERVPDSVLWLQDPGDPAKANLRGAAECAGIAPARLCFVGRIEHVKHLERQQAADLFLDTFTHGAHATGLDALHACVPLVTRQGDSLAARVGASLLTAVGLPELISCTTQAYIECACELAHDLDRLAGIRRRLSATIENDNPFASASVATKIEAAFELMWEHHCAGESPADLHTDV